MRFNCHVYVGVLALLFSSSAFALVPIDGECFYQVFSGSYIHAKNADFNGSTAAASDVNLIDQFNVHITNDACVGLVAGGSVSVANGSVDGNLQAGGNVTIAPDANVNDGTITAVGAINEHGYTNGQYDHSQTDNVALLSAVTQRYLSLSDQVGALCANSTADLGSTISFLDQKSSPPVRVYTITTSQLANASTLYFQGEPGEVIVVNVIGSSAAIVKKNMQMSSDLKMGQIVLNFPQATSLEIADSGGAGIDIPFTVLAPRAKLTFQRAAINGGLYVASIDDVHGQVNQVTPPWSQIPSSNSCPSNAPNPGFSGSGSLPSFSGMLNTIEGWFGHGSSQ